MNYTEQNSSLNFASFIRNRVSRFGRFGLSKKYQQALITPLSDEQRKSVIEKLREKGLPPKQEWNKFRYDSSVNKRNDENDRKKVTFENRNRDSICIDATARFMEDLLSSAPSSPSMSDRQINIRPGTLRFTNLEAAQQSDVSLSAPSSPGAEVGYYDTIPLLPECRDQQTELFHPANVPFKSFFPFQSNAPNDIINIQPQDRLRYVVGSEEPQAPLTDSFRLRSSRVQSLSQLMEKLQIKHLIPTFKLFGIEDLRTFTKINESMLERMAINNMEIRTKILTAIELLSEAEDSSDEGKKESKTEKGEMISNEIISGINKRNTFSVDSTKFSSQKDCTSFGNVNVNCAPKHTSQHISRSNKPQKDPKSCHRKTVAPSPHRTSSNQRRNQSSKRTSSRGHKSDSQSHMIMDVTPCSSTFTASGSMVSGLPQLQWKLPNPRSTESVKLCVETKLLAESINLSEQPYSDQNGFSGIPLRLIERYSYELDKDMRDVAIAMETIRTDKLLISSRPVRSNMEAILSDQFLNCDGIKTDSLESFLISIGLPMYVAKVKQKCRSLQTLLLYSDDALCRNFNIHPTHVRWIRREASFFPIGFLSQISHHQRLRTPSDSKFFALDRV